MQETWVRFLGWEDPLGKGKATHSSILAWTIPWTVACQAPLSMEISRQEFWSGLPFHSPGDFPNRRIEPMSPALRGRFFTSWDTREAWVYLTSTQFYIQIHLASQGCCKWQRIRLLMQNTQETRVWSLDWKNPWRRKWQSTPVFLAWRIPWTEEPGSPWGHKLNKELQNPQLLGPGLLPVFLELTSFQKKRKP